MGSATPVQFQQKRQAIVSSGSLPPPPLQPPLTVSPISPSGVPLIPPSDVPLIPPPPPEVQLFLDRYNICTNYSKQHMKNEKCKTCQKIHLASWTMSLIIMYQNDIVFDYFMQNPTFFCEKKHDVSAEEYEKTTIDMLCRGVEYAARYKRLDYMKKMLEKATRNFGKAWLVETLFGNTNKITSTLLTSCIECAWLCLPHLQHKIFNPQARWGCVDLLHCLLDAGADIHQTTAYDHCIRKDSMRHVYHELGICENDDDKGVVEDRVRSHAIALRKAELLEQMKTKLQIEYGDDVVSMAFQQNRIDLVRSLVDRGGYVPRCCHLHPSYSTSATYAMTKHWFQMAYFLMCCGVRVERPSGKFIRYVLGRTYRDVKTIARLYYTLLQCKKNQNRFSTPNNNNKNNRGRRHLISLLPYLVWNNIIARSIEHIKPNNIYVRMVQQNLRHEDDLLHGSTNHVVRQQNPFYGKHL